MRFVLVAAWSFLWAVALAAQVDPRTALLERAGWDAVAAGEAHAAAEAFREAVRRDTTNNEAKGRLRAIGRQ